MRVFPHSGEGRWSRLRDSLLLTVAGMKMPGSESQNHFPMLSLAFSREVPRLQEGDPSTRVTEPGRNLRLEAWFNTTFGSLY